MRCATRSEDYLDPPENLLKCPKTSHQGPTQMAELGVAVGVWGGGGGQEGGRRQ